MNKIEPESHTGNMVFTQSVSKYVYISMNVYIQYTDIRTHDELNY